ncbi:MAG: glycosyl transferase family 2, partial [Acidobacteriota bacterium]
RSVTPEWVRLLATPVLEGKADFVAPLYNRYKYDGTITNNIVYPLTRALFGVRVRQPIGGDYAFTGRLAGMYATADVWTTDVARFGIDIWMTLMAVCWDQRLAQVYLGTKIHNPKDPAADLSAMFCQVVSTLFYVAGETASRVRSTKSSIPVEVAGRIPRTIPIEPIDVNVRAMDQEFLDGFEHFLPMYKQVLDADNFRQLQGHAASLSSNGAPEFSATLWARTLFDFLYVYQVWNRNRRRLVDMLVPLHFGRLGSYCRSVENLEGEEVENFVEAQAEAFESEKAYLLERWT